LTEKRFRRMIKPHIISTTPNIISRVRLRLLRENILSSTYGIMPVIPSKRKKIPTKIFNIFIDIYSPHSLEYPDRCKTLPLFCSKIKYFLRVIPEKKLFTRRNFILIFY